MNNMQAIVWFFPILFMFHDFEEIILIQQWISKNRHYLSERFPTLSKNYCLILTILQHHLSHLE